MGHPPGLPGTAAPEEQQLEEQERETSYQEDKQEFLGSLFLGNSHQVLPLVAAPDLAARAAQVAVADSQ